MRFDEVLKSFDLYLQTSGFATNSRSSYARTLRKFAEYLELADRTHQIERLKKEDITGFLGACEDAGEKRSSIILRLLICKKFFAWLKDQRLTSEDPARDIPVPRAEKQPPRYASVAQIESLLNQPDTTTPHGLRDRALLEVIYSSGLRISEALALEIRDINFAEGFIHVRNGKDGKARTIPAGSTALQWLARFLEQGRSRLLSGSANQIIFVNNAGGRLSRQSAAAAVRAYARTAGLPVWITPHLLRHCCASHMLEGGAGLPYIQEQLGHACMESTRIYLAVRREELKSVHSSCHPRS